MRKPIGSIIARVRERHRQAVLRRVEAFEINGGAKWHIIEGPPGRVHLCKELQPWWLKLKG